MKRIFRKKGRWKGKPIEYGLQILFGLPHIKKETGKKWFTVPYTHGENAYASWDYQLWLELKVIPLGAEVIKGDSPCAVADTVDKVLVDEIKFIDGKIKEGYWSASMGGTKEEAMLWWEGQLNRLQTVREKILKATASL